MAKSISFKTANKFLLNAISKAPEKKQQKVFKDKFKIYKKRMQNNADKFFKTKGQAKDFMDTIKTIEKKIDAHLAKGVYDQKELQRQMNGLITRSRKYQKQAKIVEKNGEFIKDSDTDSIWDYIITHPIKTVHSDECADRLNRSPFTKKEAEAEIPNLPQHANCECYFKERRRQTSRRFEQGNI